MAILLLGASTACTVTERPGEEDSDGFLFGPRGDLARIEPMLQSSARSWNAGDLDGFLDDYASDPTLTFVGASGILRGIGEVRATYLEGYWESGAPADSLRFAEIEVRPLGEIHALATGRWILYQPSGAQDEEITGEGRFSLILRWMDGRWEIIHDHSS